MPSNRLEWAQWHLDRAIETGNPIMIARCRKYLEREKEAVGHGT